MPLLKPGRWSVNPADIELRYLNFWNGLIFASPMWGNAEETDIVSGRLSSTAGNLPLRTPGQFGIGRRFDRASQKALEWANHPNYDRLNTTSAFTYFVAISQFEANVDPTPALLAVEADATNRNGIYFDAARNIDFHLGTTRLDGNQATQPQAWAAAARWDGALLYGDHWDADTGESVFSGSTAETFQIPAGGKVHMGPGTVDTSGKWGGISYVAYIWDRWVTSTDLQLLVADPFGPIRPALFIDAALTVTLFATADGTIIDVVNEADNATPLWSSIDDDPASPTDTDWINNAIDPGTVSNFVDVTDVPTDFGNADTATIIVRFRGQNWGGGTRTLLTQIFQSNESTTMSDEVTVATVTANGAFDNTASLTLTGLDTTSGKSVWDAARIRFRWT